MKLGRPQYRGDTDSVHEKEQPIGVLLANLGSPAAPTAAAVRPYLRQFLSDPRVIESPRWLWWFMLNCIIVPWRAPITAAAYRKVWTTAGSPLLAISRRQTAALATQLGNNTQVALGMSYGEPSIISALRELHVANCRQILVLPLYPQYAASTIGTVFDTVAKELASWRWVPQLRLIAGYCQHDKYIDTLAASIQTHEQEHGQPNLTVFSYHGMQLAALEAGDPYHCQCHRTARATAAKLGWDDQRWRVTFQSRFGKDLWLQPFTIEVMASLPSRGITNVHVVCPAFATDCLETLEEICDKNRTVFLKAGGKKFSYIPALNDTPAHINFLTQLIQEHTHGWLATTPTNADVQHVQAVRQLTTAVRCKKTNV